MNLFKIIPRTTKHNSYHSFLVKSENQLSKVYSEKAVEI